MEFGIYRVKCGLYVHIHTKYENGSFSGTLLDKNKETCYNASGFGITVQYDDSGITYIDEMEIIEKV